MQHWYPDDLLLRWSAPITDAQKKMEGMAFL
jgi:hypothetical protein